MMSWNEHPGVPGGRIKVLSQDASGYATVMLNWPPVLAPHAPERHYHRSVVEHGYVLAGELAIREYDDAEDERGALVPFRSGYFYRRLPGSVHGVDPARTVGGTGFEILEWRSGPGTYLWEQGAERETVSMPLPAGATQPSAEAVCDERGVVRDREHVTILDTRQVRWGPHSGHRRRPRPGARRRRRRQPAGAARLDPAHGRRRTGAPSPSHRHGVRLRAGRTPGVGGARGARRRLRQHRAAARPVLLRAPPGAVHALGAVEDADDPGCLVSNGGRVRAPTPAIAARRPERLAR